MNVKRLAILTLAALTSLHTHAQPAYTRNWRDGFTPWTDPLRAQPKQLQQPLQLQIPVELHAPSPALQRPQPEPAQKTAPSDAIPRAAMSSKSSSPNATSVNTSNSDEAAAASTVLATLSCATAEQAASLASPQQALALLKNNQPTSTEQTPRQPSDLDKPLLLTLPQAIQLALCHNPKVRLSWSQIAQQAAALGQARSAWLPQLSAGMGRQRSQLRYPQAAAPSGRAYRNTYASTQNVGLRWRLWDFGARSAQTDAARLQLQATLANQNEAVYQTLVDVLQKYTDAQIAHSRLHAQHALRVVAQRSLETTRRRQKQGASSMHDSLHAMSDLARTNLEISRYQGDYSKTLAQLIYMLGLPANTPVLLESISASRLNAKQQKETNALMHKALDEWLQNMRQNHPTIKAARAQWQAAQANIQAAQAEGLPSIDVSYNYYRNGRPNQSLSSMRNRERLVGITLTIPLFDGFATTYKVRNAQAIAKQKAVEYQATEQQVLQDMVSTYADAQSAWRTLNAANGLLVIAREAQQSTQRLYQRGAADILQLNHALSNLEQAQQEQAQAQAEWLRARLKLWLAEVQAGI